MKSSVNGCHCRNLKKEFPIFSREALYHDNHSTYDFQQLVNGMVNIFDNLQMLCLTIFTSHLDVQVENKTRGY